MENMGRNYNGLNDFLEEAELQQYSDLFRDILKITKLSQLKFVVTEDLVQIGLSRPEQRRYKKVYSRYFPNPYIYRIRKLLSAQRKHNDSSQTQTSVPVDLQPFNDTSVKIPTKHIISIDDITINKELGKGQFGVVQQGTWTTGNQRLQVAIKCLGQERMSSNSAEFLKEAAVMHSIEHANIVRLYGVVLHSDSLMLVTELAPLRSLLECVREVSLRPEFLVPTLCNFAEQICDGMHYLEQKRLIHRDLAARNILVFSKDRVKISDFGLSRALGVGKDYYQTNYNVNLKLPVAWCAPECILFLRFTSSSDVWAFGVCLWEMLTYGFQPWAGFSGQQILEAIDSPICQRLERPPCSTEDYYRIMLACWSHEPNHRPKFSELGTILRNSRPELVQATVTFSKPKNGRNNHLLVYEAGEIITILGKEDVTKLPLWYGVAPCGACGLFDPRNTKPYFATYPPRQIVTPYKPSEDLEQVPLINPNSPSHLTGGASGSTPYPILAPKKIEKAERDEMPGDKKNTRKGGQKSSSESGSASRSLLSKVKYATLGRAQRAEVVASVFKPEDSHEYHEITDNDTSESTSKSSPRAETLAQSSTSADFSQSLLDEMESLFRNLDTEPRQDEPSTSAKTTEGTPTNKRAYTMSRHEKKRSASPSTMKPMSAHDEKTLNTAVALANEITAKSMNDLDVDKPKPHSPSDRSRFHFKFPNYLQQSHHSDVEKDKDHAGKTERRNFSDEANSVPDIQATLTEESIMAYTSLIENPIPSSSLMRYEPSTYEYKPPTSARSAGPSSSFTLVQSHQQNVHGYNRPMPTRDEEFTPQNIENPLPLPPRNTKPKLVDKPRHIRKYPLKIIEEVHLPAKPLTEPKPNIYQNTSNPNKRVQKVTPGQVHHVSTNVDVHDGPEPTKLTTNPFTNEPRPSIAGPSTSDLVRPGPSGANPFKSYSFDEDDGDVEIDIIEIFSDESEEETDVAGALVKDCKDHVSVEDLLEFADQKPCGRQRGEESDEVRIMSKVFKKEVTSGECLEALELSDWNVHNAIKLVRVSVSVGTKVSLETCSTELSKANGDINKASAVLVSCKQKT